MRDFNTKMNHFWDTISRDISDVTTDAKLKQYEVFLTEAINDEELIDSALTDGVCNIDDNVTTKTIFFNSRKKYIVAASIATAGLTVFFLFGSEPEELRFSVGKEYTIGFPGQTVMSPPGTTTAVSFEQGSVVHVISNSVARVTEATSEQVVIDLQRGSVVADIRGNRVTKWSVNAGPYGVHVLGTKFEVAWHSDTHVFDVKVAQGTVRVTGVGVSKEDITVTKGDHLRVNNKRGGFTLLRIDSEYYDPKKKGLVSETAVRHVAQIGDEPTNTNPKKPNFFW